jgi:hypothetical protein
MIRRQTLLVLVLVAFTLSLAVGGAALAQTSASFNLEWHVIGGGGHPVTSASYVVNSTIGQGAASPPFSFCGDYAVSGGYWFGEDIPVISKYYLPLVLRNVP